ncbi:MAG: hypothetical protein ACR2Q4_00795 [Geminicoccaceae bacterium]
MPKRIVIVDPSLRDARGHHYALTRRVTESIVHEGFEPIWLCHRDAAFTETGGAAVVPALSVSLYDAYHQSRLRRAVPQRLRRPAKTLAGIIRRQWQRRGNGKKHPAAHERLAADLEGALDALGLSSEDRLLFHTADGQTYAAVDLVLRSSDANELPRVHICTPYDPAGIMPNQVADLPIQRCIDRWRDLGLLASRLHLYAENPVLAEHLSALWRARVLPLELPAIPINQEGMVQDVAWPGADRATPLKVVHLGPARAEKGFHHLPEIIEGCLGAIESGRRRPVPVSFVIQCSPQITGYTPPIAKAIERLKQFPDGLVRLLDQTLSDTSYGSWLGSSDLVLLPYGAREYGKRSSGIVAEALSLGKIIVATAGTYPASMIGAGAGAFGATPSELGRGIADIAGDPEPFRAGAAAAGLQYRLRNDPKAYIGKCLKAEEGDLEQGPVRQPSHPA